MKTTAIAPGRSKVILGAALGDLPRTKVQLVSAERAAEISAELRAAA